MPIKFIDEPASRKRRQKVKLASFLTGGLVVLGVLAILNYLIPTLIPKTNSANQGVLAANATFDALTIAPSNDEGVYGGDVLHQDPRVYVLDKYFARYDSPLKGTGKIFVGACRKYAAPQDCLIVAAIAHAETDLCKYYTSADYHNCWGFGGGGADRMRFGSWEESIERVYRTLASSGLYGNDVMINPRLMEKTFCGSEPGCTGWGNRVIYFMDNIDAYAKELGVKKGMYGFR
jgi:hypothetical protein